MPNIHTPIISQFKTVDKPPDVGRLYGYRRGASWRVRRLFFVLIFLEKALQCMNGNSRENIG